MTPQEAKAKAESIIDWANNGEGITIGAYELAGWALDVLKVVRFYADRTLYEFNGIGVQALEDKGKVARDFLAGKVSE